MPADDAVLAIHCHAREVADMLPCAGELVEKGGLAAVLVAHQCEGQRGTLRQEITAALGVEFAFFPEPRMRVILFLFAAFFFAAAGLQRFDLDAVRFRQAQGEFVAVKAHFHGVAHGSVFHDFDFRSGYQPHVEKMLTQCSVPSDCRDERRFTDRKLL